MTLEPRLQRPLPFQTENLGRPRRHPLDELPRRQHLLVHEVGHDDRQHRLEPDHPERGPGEAGFLAVARMGRVVGRDRVDRSVREALQNRFLVLERSELNVALRVGNLFAGRRLYLKSLIVLPNLLQTLDEEFIAFFFKCLCTFTLRLSNT